MYFVFRRDDGYVDVVNAADRNTYERRVAAPRRFDLLLETAEWNEARAKVESVRWGTPEPQLARSAG